MFDDPSVSNFYQMSLLVTEKRAREKCIWRERQRKRKEGKKEAS